MDAVTNACLWPHGTQYEAAILSFVGPGQASVLAAFPSTRKVVARRRLLSPKEGSLLRHFTDITILGRNRCRLPDAALLAALERADKAPLRRLVLGSLSTHEGVDLSAGGGTAAFAAMDGLEDLELLGVTGMDPVSLRLPPSLRRLRIEQCDGLQPPILQHCRRLRSLSWGIGPVDEAWLGVDLADMCPDLEEVRLWITHPDPAEPTLRLPKVTWSRLLRLRRVEVAVYGHPAAPANPTQVAQWLCGLPSSVAELDLSGVHGLEACPAFAFPRMLHTLSLTHPVGPVTVGGSGSGGGGPVPVFSFAVLAGLAGLRKLYVRTGRGIGVDTDLASACPGLEDVCLHVSDADVTATAPFLGLPPFTWAALPRLRKLVVTVMSSSKRAVWVERIGGQGWLSGLPPWLEELTVDARGQPLLTDDDILSLPSLKRLHLQYCSGVTGWTPADMPQLQSLYLGGSGVRSPTELSSLALVRDCTALTSVELASCKSIDAHGLSQLPRSVRSITLQCCSGGWAGRKLGREEVVSACPQVEHVKIVE